jgi:hypothetical protein
MPVAGLEPASEPLQTRVVTGFYALFSAALTCENTPHG